MVCVCPMIDKSDTKRTWCKSELNKYDNRTQHLTHFNRQILIGFYVFTHNKAGLPLSIEARLTANYVSVRRGTVVCHRFTAIHSISF